MVAQHARIAWHTGWAVLLTLSLLVLLVGDGGAAGKPLERPNSLEVAWTFTTAARALDVSDRPAALNDRMLAIPHGRTVSVVDTHNGHLLSTLRSSAREFAPGGFSGGVVFAAEQGRDRRNSLTAYDPATGRKLWQKAAKPAAQRGRDDWRGNAPLLTDPGPVIDAAHDRLVGLAPRTGAVRWSKRMPALAPCEQAQPGDSGLPSSPYNAGGTAHHLVLLKGCPGLPVELEAVDPESGDTVWKKRLGRWRESARLSVVRDAIAVTVGNELRVFAESGEELLRRKEGPKSELWPVGEARGLVYLSEVHYGVKSDPGSIRSRTLHAVRTDTGKIMWTRSQELVGGDELNSEVIAGPVEVAGAYAGDLRWSVGDARLRGPGASSLMDLAGRRSASVPWPVAGTYVGMSGQLLIVRSEEKDGTRYTALRPVHRAVDTERPAALGGAQRKDWPDACGLVGAGLLSELGRDYVKVPAKSSRTVLGARLPHPSVCRFVPESGSDDKDIEDHIFSVSVRWVAPDAKGARTYATSVLPWGCNPWLGGCVTAEIVKPQRGVYLYTYRVTLEQRPVAHATVVSGRYVFGVSAGNNEARAQRLIRRMATHLAQHAEP